MNICMDEDEENKEEERHELRKKKRTNYMKMGLLLFGLMSETMMMIMQRNKWKIVVVKETVS